MPFFKKIVCSIIYLCFTVHAAAVGQNTPVTFQDGQSICFLGNSITEGGMYPSYIKLFYLTRYPLHNSYLKSQTEKYLFYKDVLAETLKELTLLDQMLQLANQPIIHKYDVVQLND
jgi:hypothetical protein